MKVCMYVCVCANHSGILDFYIFIGSRPDDVMNQYQEVIGRPAMPPYWALGYHQCRWGYKDLQEVKDVVNNFAKEEVGSVIN